ncbi:hypothetical protein A3Q56_03069 [Intoshia linei]|uniref:RING-type E3 ubiquitin transferase n=1 Tax=Intoshia linei TaxID=1819745 RepID=A0A177B699_9BILA|nr:hypothetical protein A3Q56_03069 [Intoshia linei]
MNSKSPNTKLLPCMYYLKNSCTSDRCTFSHNYEIPSNDFCKYHFRGTCTYGKKCRLIHLKPKDIISTNQKDILVKYDLPPFTKPSTSAIEYSRIPHKSPSKTMHKDIPISFDQAVSINNYELSLRRQQKVLENKQICKFNMVNDCPYQDKDCVDLHNGIICQYCGLKKVHPHSKSKAAAHLKV